MRRNGIVAAAFALAVVLGTACPLAAEEEPILNLRFAGENSFADVAGAAVQAGYDCTLTQTGGTSGAQGWSLSMTAEGASITSVTTDCTYAGDPAADPPPVCPPDAPETLYKGGFNKTELTLAEAESVDDCEGKAGAVSAIVLALVEKVTLPAPPSPEDTVGPFLIAKIEVESVIPETAGAFVLRYVNSCKGSGKVVPNKITLGGKSKDPILNPLSVSLTPKVSCAGTIGNLGFSAESINQVGLGGASSVFDYVLGDEGAEGEIEVDAPEGETRQGDVFMNVLSNIQDPQAPQVKGWSLAIAFSGAPEQLLEATTDGTSVPLYYNNGFNKTEIIDPTKEIGDPPAQQGPGAVSAVVLALTEQVTLPPIGVESVLKLTVEGESPQVVRLAPKNGLIGSGKPVPNKLTVGGTSVDPCNLATVSVDVKFVIPSGPTLKSFKRGDANSDDKIDIADPIWIVSMKFRGGPESPCMDAADANDNGEVDASDVVWLIEYLFNGGSEPLAPFPGCGTDPGGDPATCLEATEGC